MKETFVLIFREGRQLSDEEQKRRAEAVRAWALQEVQRHNLEPRILAHESHQLGDGIAAESGRRVIALNFIEADDFGEAVKIAESHPGLAYGVGIEVRPWRDPRAARA